MHAWGCMHNVCMGGACTMHVWGVHVQCTHGTCMHNACMGGAHAMHVWEVQLISLCGGVSLQLIRLVNANDLIGCSGDP